LLLIGLWGMVVVSALLTVQPRLPFTLAIAGAVLGALAGIMQHLSISQDPQRFFEASSMMGVRRALTRTPWGRRYIAWLYFSKVVLVLVALLLLVKSTVLRVLMGYVVAYMSLMLVRDVITLKDTFALRTLDKRASSSETGDSGPPSQLA
jgi:hypothetical protein